MNLQQILNPLPQDDPNIPNYCGIPAVQAALYYLVNFTKNREDNVSTWAATMAKEVFAGGRYAISPEKWIQSTFDNTRKRPDIVIEKVVEKDNCYMLKPKIYFELKRQSSNFRFEDALQQVTDYIHDPTDVNDGYYQDTDTSDVFIVVMKGFNIAFFEYDVYHEYYEEIGEYDIPNFEHAIPLTQPIKDKHHDMDPVLNNIPDDVKLLYHNTENLKITTEAREKASTIKTPCVFDIRKHQKEINFFFHHMANNTTRC